MRVFLFLTVLLCTCFLSCNRKTKPPIDFVTMKGVLYDIYVAEVRAGMTDSMVGLVRNKDSIKLNEGYTAVLQHYDIDLATFEHALIWYTEHPILLDSMYQILIAQNDSLQRAYEAFRKVQPTLPEDPDERAAMEAVHVDEVSN